MSRKKLSHIQQIVARLDAEDRAYAHLRNLPPEVAIVVASPVAARLTLDWRRQQEELIRSGDRGKWVCCTNQEVRELIAARTAVPRDAPSDADAEERMLSVLGEIRL